MRMYRPGVQAGFASARAYQGPGDIVANAYVWYGLRAYQNSSIVNTPAVNLRRDSDNATSNFGFRTDGSLDVGAIAAFKGAANLFVTTIFDQAGKGLHLVQATTASQPGFTLNGLGALPVIDTTGTTGLTTIGLLKLSIGPQTSGTAVSIAGVAQRTTDVTGNLGTIIATNSGLSGLWFDAAPSHNLVLFGLSGTNSISLPAANGTWYAAQGVVAAGSGTSRLTANGSAQQTSTLLGGFSITGSLGVVTDTNANSLVGRWTECGMWATDFTSQIAAINTNQRNYWGI